MIRDELNATYALLSDWMAARVEESPELEHATELRFDREWRSGYNGENLVWFVSLTSKKGDHDKPGFIWFYGQSFAATPTEAFREALEQWADERAAKSKGAA